MLCFLKIKASVSYWRDGVRLQTHTRRMKRHIIGVTEYQLRTSDTGDTVDLGGSKLSYDLLSY